MNKYVEQIKAEIERRKAIASAVSYIGQALLCEDLLDFINSLPEEKPSEDLDLAAEDTLQSIGVYSFSEEHRKQVLAMFYAGYNACKEQMMKDAVEGLVCSALENVNYVRTTGRIPSDFYFGEKVKLIIVKGD